MLRQRSKKHWKNVMNWKKPGALFTEDIYENAIDAFKTVRLL